MEELYTQKIDEFVDWVSGENSFTGENVTGGLKVSGGKIRELPFRAKKLATCGQRILQIMRIYSCLVLLDQVIINLILL